MSIPYFFIPAYREGQQQLVLDEDSSRHILRVLRMKEGEVLQLADGKGHLLRAVITGQDKKKCTVKITETSWQPRPAPAISVALSLLKNSHRYEWFLEKAAEIGVRTIIPLLCERTEKQQFRAERMKGILVSAMLQSQQAWLPELSTPLRLEEVLKGSLQQKKWVAHCADQEKISLRSQAAGDHSSALILIGPEGDFTDREIDLALKNEFIPVTLGENRLRSETAAVVAAGLLRIW
ncbi:MAG TPA: RsmE family RNA methyltransferase [Puia sp.]|nr:RsmE family RNA methyltransferase [Puia sp.]